MSVFDSIDSVFGADFANGPTVNPQYQPLQPKRNVATPREWVGLTDEEIQNIAFDAADQESAIIQAEAKLKEKNT